MSLAEKFFPVRLYNLDATLDSGQAFRWKRQGDGWTGIICGRWVWLKSIPHGGSERGETPSQLQESGILAQTPGPVDNWTWLADYLQLDADLEKVMETFPRDEHIQNAIRVCGGLRLLRQDPWEALASFILSSTKQIVQIRQIISLLCERHGEPVVTPEEVAPAFAFPKASKLALLSEKELRDCKMGFRAPYLLGAARAVDSGQLDLESIRRLPLHEAREKLVSLKGVGLKIADCALLFGYGHPQAFPVDVWVMRALRELYFPRRKPSARRLEKFITAYFGPNSGYAQQYLFHYMRTRDSSGK